MIDKLCIIGFGEAGRTIAEAGGWEARAAAYDIKTDAAETRELKTRDFAAAQVKGCDRLQDAVSGAQLILSLVTADQASVAASQVAAYIGPGSLYCDMNSVAPDTKSQACETITKAGGRFVDVAIMSSIQPAEMDTPLLVSGPHADDALQALKEQGFTNIRAVGAQIGQASATKMIRSIVVKGLEALTAECVLAADRAGVLEDVAASLGSNWLDTANYRFERMLVHGQRRAAEMDEVVRTLDALGTGSIMARGTAERQRALGQLGLTTPAADLEAKLAQLKGKIAA